MPHFTACTTHRRPPSGPSLRERHTMHVRSFLAVAISGPAVLASDVLHRRLGRAPPTRTRRHRWAPRPRRLIGVGSDTTQHAVNCRRRLQRRTAPPARSFTYAACRRGRLRAGHVILSGDGAPPERVRHRQEDALRRDQQHRCRLRPLVVGAAPPRPPPACSMFPFALDELKLSVTETVPTPRAPDPGADRDHLQGRRHELEPDRRHRRCHRAEDPAAGLRHPLASGTASSRR